MSSKDQVKSLGNNVRLQEPQDHGNNNPDDAEMTPPNNRKAPKNESPPATPMLKSASQKTSIPLVSAAPQASGSGDTQLQTHDQELHQHTSRTAGGQGPPIGQGPSNEQLVQQSEPPKAAAALATASIDQLTAFWEKYNAIGDKEAKEFVASAGGDLDNLLIFAGLFSTIDTAFIIESYRGLKPDPADEAT